MGICDGRVVIVTGSGRGIGREHALAYAREGAKVVVNDLGGDMHGDGGSSSPAMEVVEEIKAMGGEAVADGENVADFAGAGRLVQRAIDTFGHLDTLVNNAGILRDRMLANMEESEWDAVIAVHLKGAFSPTRHAAAYWRDQAKAGTPLKARVVNTSSPSGIFGNAGQTNYGAAKAGIAAFTIIAARELKRYGVTVNAVAPVALTRMTAGLRERTEEQKAAMHPGRVSPVVVWMASVESADFTGRIVEAGGGLLSVAEGWHRGPTAEPTEDPTKLGPIMTELQARARKNAGMDSADLD
jgi:NAD(P)-dependent dehydrogenase (short-subunit alcohol dehydrogenase family)